MVHAFVRFFRTPPRTLRIVVGFALTTEALGFALAVPSLGSVFRDAAHAGGAVAGTLLFAAAASALHLVLAAIVIDAALLVRRAPWLAASLAAVPIALAWFGFRTSVGYAVATPNVRLALETPLALLEGLAIHVIAAALACVIVLVALPFGLFRRGGAEGGRHASNGKAS